MTSSRSVHLEDDLDDVKPQPLPKKTPSMTSSRSLYLEDALDDVE